uniref:Uncharacterized protein n=1 Tax=Phlebotomus papatasi TaxID=29031 RepID=A0A1B0GQH0_PHLPP
MYVSALQQCHDSDSALEAEDMLSTIYVHISDKVVGLLLRARKHKLIDFEGEVLFQRRDDDVPIFMLKTMEEIRAYVREKEDEVRRSISPNPQAMLQGGHFDPPSQ